MTHQPPAFAPAAIDAGDQLARLRHVLRLVEQIAGRTISGAENDVALDEGARLSGAYENALPVVQRRFDTLAGETATWAAAGVEALLASGDEAAPPRAAAACLADELRRALARLATILR